MATLRLRGRIKFFASLFDGIGTSVRKDGLASYVDLDNSKFSLITSYNPSGKQITVQDTTDGSFALVTITQLLTGSQTQQIKTDTGDVNVALTDGLIAVNKTVGAATAVNLPAASAKVGPVKVADWKGDSGTNAITVNATGTDKLNGNSTSMVINADRASLVFTPLSDGSGYAY